MTGSTPDRACSLKTCPMPATAWLPISAPAGAICRPSLAERTAGLKAIDLYEADYESLEAAKANLAALPGAPATGFFWHDLVGEKVEKKYDLIVMNPPFHQGRAAEPEIGQAMIRAASSALEARRPPVHGAKSRPALRPDA